MLGAKISFLLGKWPMADCYVKLCANWKDLPYFISSRETTFETKILSQLNAEILIGVMSYKQQAEIVRGYERLTKEDATNDYCQW